MLYEYVRVKEGFASQFESVLNLPKKKIKSPEVFCEFIQSWGIRKYGVNKIKGRTLRAFYEKYKEEYNLQIVLSDTEILHLFLYYHPYPQYNRDIVQKVGKYVSVWKDLELQEALTQQWGYILSKSTCYKAIKQFYTVM